MYEFEDMEGSQKTCSRQQNDEISTHTFNPLLFGYLRSAMSTLESQNEILTILAAYSAAKSSTVNNPIKNFETDFSPYDNGTPIILCALGLSEPGSVYNKPNRALVK